MNITAKNAFLNAFVDYYHYRFLKETLFHSFANREDIRKVNIHMKLTGRNWVEEMEKFIAIFEDEDIALDFGLDHYDTAFPMGVHAQQYFKQL